MLTGRLLCLYCAVVCTQCALAVPHPHSLWSQALPLQLSTVLGSAPPLVLAALVRSRATVSTSAVGSLLVPFSIKMQPLVCSFGEHRNIAPQVHTRMLHSVLANGKIAVAALPNSFIAWPL